jgi:signal transduction histidine kinase
VVPVEHDDGDDDTEEGHVVGIFHFEVKDSGPGIAKSQQARLFQKFSRIDSPENRHIGGVGLGLYLVRTIAEQHGGEVAVESRQGQGATFKLSLPLRRHTEPAARGGRGDAVREGAPA